MNKKIILFLCSFPLAFALSASVFFYFDSPFNVLLMIGFVLLAIPVRAFLGRSDQADSPDDHGHRGPS
ncbi:hypothetical protein [Brevibacterium yomogidense]|uniref:hypothetical protein n=1 Tax=Brevibacterium yomogidense TaxID=946573 RepID=UPI0018E01BD8|nr:hypothetical protein [Brevibacterium yomogidense]